MRVAVCCIVKLENNYIREWVEHYKSINVDNIIMCDNNDIDGESLSDVIGDYIDNGFVIVENYRGKTSCQCQAYKDSFTKYKTSYDWIAFFDADEFLDVIDIKEFLSDEKFKDYDCVRVPWKVFDDSNIIETNGDYSVKRFKTFRYCRQSKAIVNTLFNKNSFFSPHGPLMVKACDPNGNDCMSINEFICDSIKEKKYKVWINHYMLKTLEEYVTKKMVRLYPDQSENMAKRTLTLERFFMLNELTKEKIEWLNKNGLQLKTKNGEIQYIRDKNFYENWFK